MSGLRSGRHDSRAEYGEITENTDTPRRSRTMEPPSAARDRRHAPLLAAMSVCAPISASRCVPGLGLQEGSEGGSLHGKTATSHMPPLLTMPAAGWPAASPAASKTVPCMRVSSVAGQRCVRGAACHASLKERTMRPQRTSTILARASRRVDSVSIMRIYERILAMEDFRGCMGGGARWETQQKGENTHTYTHTQTKHSLQPATATCSTVACYIVSPYTTQWQPMPLARCAGHRARKERTRKESNRVTAEAAWGQRRAIRRTAAGLPEHPQGSLPVAGSSREDE